MACPHLIPATTVLQRVREVLEAIMSTQVHKEMDAANLSQMLEMHGALKRYQSPNRLDPRFSRNLHNPLPINTALLDHRAMLNKWALLLAVVNMPCKGTTRPKHLQE